jgi:hypothetical protein
MSTAKKPAKSRTVTAKTCKYKVYKKAGLNLDGSLKKGYHYTPAGRIVKTVIKKKPAAKKKVVAKKKPAGKKKVAAKKPTKKKFLGIF